MNPNQGCSAKFWFPTPQNDQYHEQQGKSEKLSPVQRRASRLDEEEKYSFWERKNMVLLGKKSMARLMKSGIQCSYQS
jgi:hypothetical protein